MITLTNPTAISLLGTFVIPVMLPIMVGLVTTKLTDSGIKSALLAALSIFTSLATHALEAFNGGAPFDLVAALPGAISTFTIAVATYYGLWKPTGVAKFTQETGRVAKD